MSRHLLIRCDAPGCTEQTETRAPDSEPASVSVPDGWLTVRQEAVPDRHFCSRVCLAAAYAVYLSRVELAQATAPTPKASAQPAITPPPTFAPGEALAPVAVAKSAARRSAR